VLQLRLHQRKLRAQLDLTAGALEFSRSLSLLTSRLITLALGLVAHLTRSRLGPNLRLLGQASLCLEQQPLLFLLASMGLSLFRSTLLFLYEQELKGRCH
jgi:hypothetical protein